MHGSNSDTDDLSAGNASREDAYFAKTLLIAEQQKAAFKKRSFWAAWFFSGLFFISVISFSWAIMFCPKVFLLTQAIHSGEVNVFSKEAESTEVKEKTNLKVKNSNSKNESKIESEKTHRENLFNQFLIMLALLSAVGTTLAIAVMRFSFSNESSNESSSEKNSIISFSPLANSVAELIDQIIAVIKNRTKSD